MMFGLMRVRTHDAEMAKVRGERDQANTDKRTIGAALHEMLRERNALQARLDALTPARREDGRFVGKATLPRQDDKAGSDAAEAAAFDAPPNRWGMWEIRHGR